ncbi:MAG: N-acetyltransferase [Chlorobiaceae bacterium]|nr:N-acetyltransferase [Chlorobiaceae bacterium]
MIRIRKEEPRDINAIDQVTRSAFEHHPISRQTEQYIVKALRTSGALSLSLVAELDGRIVGHIAFSPVTISDGTNAWYGIGPLSVAPEFQRRGFGSSLMRAGMDYIKEMGGNGCALVGDPNYYIRFGFHNLPKLIHQGIPQEVFLALPFAEPAPEGFVEFNEGFLACT